MSQIKISLVIDLPDNARVSLPDVDYIEEPPGLFAPLPEPPRYDRDETVRQVAHPAPGCPDHGAMTRFPAGINKQQKPYNASWRCAVKDCPTKPIWDRDAA